jgi:tRNA threonylcarbamoyladenosine biosynthesis protein TsaE
MHVVSQGIEDTYAIAARLAGQWLAAMEGRRSALVIGLSGDLGSGKTTFVQGVAKALGVSAVPTSPTFNLMKEYRIGNGPYRLWHLDCYRLSGHQDLAPLDVPALLGNPRNLVLMEWPERVGGGLPADHVNLRFEHVDPARRRISIDSHPSRT